MDFEAAKQAAGEEEAGCTATAGECVGGPGDLGATGDLGGTGDQGGTGDPTSHGLPSDLGSQYGPPGPTNPDGPSIQSGPCSPPGQCGPGSPDNQGGLASRGGPEEEETLGAAAIGTATVARALHVSEAVGPRNRRIVLKFAVPFRCSLEAEVARLIMDYEDDQPAVQREMEIKGKLLLVKWTADNFDLLQVSLSDFLKKLVVVMQNIRSLWPFSPRRVDREREPGTEPGDPN